MIVNIEVNRVNHRPPNHSMRWLCCFSPKASRAHKHTKAYLSMPVVNLPLLSTLCMPSAFTESFRFMPTIVRIAYY